MDSSRNLSEKGNCRVINEGLSHTASKQSNGGEWKKQKLDLMQQLQSASGIRKRKIDNILSRLQIMEKIGYKYRALLDKLLHEQELEAEDLEKESSYTCCKQPLSFSYETPT